MFFNIQARAYLMFFFFNDTATTEIYTLSLHDALPISGAPVEVVVEKVAVDLEREHGDIGRVLRIVEDDRDRKSTRLNSSHSQISYAVFCLKKKIILCPFHSHQSFSWLNQLPIPARLPF